MRKSYTLALRFIVIGLLLLFVTYQWGDYLIKLLIPLYEWMVKELDYRFDTVTFSIIKQHGEQFLLLQTTLSIPIIVSAESTSASMSIPSGATMPLGNVLLPVILIFTTVLAWPITASHHVLRTYITRAILAMPLCLLIMLLDMPTQLLKMVWESLSQQPYLSKRNNLLDFTYWSDFLNGGGLMALSIATGILVIGLTDYLVKSKVT